MKNIIISIALCSWGLFSIAQNHQSSYINAPAELSEIVESYKEMNKRNGMQGYRVQIYTDSGNRSKLRTDRIKSQFDSKYPGVRSYISYDEPYYKLRVGDFRNRLDAEKFLNKISHKYLSAILVVDRINFPKLDDSYFDPIEVDPEEQDKESEQIKNSPD